MKQLINIAVALTFALPLATQAAARINNDAVKNTTQPAAASATQDMPVDVSVQEIRTEAKIVELEKQSRTAVLRTPEGNLVKVHVSPEVRNFDQVKVGDEVVMRYQVATAIEIQSASKNAIRERIESSNTQTNKASSLPGVEVGKRVEILANIQSINRKARTMTLRGATRTVTIVVPANIDVAKLKVGQEVHAVITDAVMIEVERA
jgi:hypothetical protein